MTLSEEVVAAARLGEAWAVRRVYEELAPAVQRYLRSRGAREPEDLTSEVFLTVFTRLAALEGGAAGLRTFAFSVAHARLVDELRRRARRPDLTPLDTALSEQGVGGVSPSAEAVAAGNLGLGELQQVLALLPEDQRDVVLLRTVGDLSLEETAKVLGRSTGAVKQLQRRGLLQLRAQLGGG